MKKTGSQKGACIPNQKGYWKKSWTLEEHNEYHYTVLQKRELRFQKAKEEGTTSVSEGIMEDGKLRLKRKEEGMLQKRVKCLVKDDATFTSRKDTEMKTGEKGRRQLQQSSHSQTFPINDLFGNSQNFLGLFPLPSLPPSPFHTVQGTNFAIHLAKDCFVLFLL